MNFADFPRMPLMSEAHLPKEVSHRFSRRVRVVAVGFIIAFCVFALAVISKASVLLVSSFGILAILACAAAVHLAKSWDQHIADHRKKIVSDYRDRLAGLPKSDLVGALSYRYELTAHEIKLIEGVLNERHPGWSIEAPGYQNQVCPKCGASCQPNPEAAHG